MNWGTTSRASLYYYWTTTAAAAAKSLQSCPTLFNPIDGSPPGSAVPGILQARTLEWVAISFSNAWKWKVKVKSLSRVRLLGTPWTAAYQAPLPMGPFRQEYWSGFAIAFSGKGWQWDLISTNQTCPASIWTLWFLEGHVSPCKSQRTNYVRRGRGYNLPRIL